MSTYACSDIHGSYELWNQIKNFLKPDDKLIFLGDAVDRGPDGIKIAKELLLDNRVTYLKGNHEDMMVNFMIPFLSDGIFNDSFYTWAQNGGTVTYDDWMNNNYNSNILYKIKKLQTSYTYKNEQGFEIVLSHAGFTPGKSKDYIWDRQHFFDTWPKGNEKTIVVHGHTPVPLIQAYFKGKRKVSHSWNIGAFWYADDHKVCIDNASFFSNKIVLLDLDTFDEHIFEV